MSNMKVFRSDGRLQSQMNRRSEDGKDDETRLAEEERDVMDDLNPGAYRHTQRAPLCLLVYGVGIALLVAAWLTRNEPPQPFTSILLASVGAVMLVLASAFHHLTVEDEGDRITIRFGPLPLFRRSVQLKDITSVEVGRTTLLEGWGIHMSFRGGWVWNLWGRDCVVLRLQKSLLRVGTDDAENLASFIDHRLRRKSDE